MPGAMWFQCLKEHRSSPLGGQGRGPVSPTYVSRQATLHDAVWPHRQKDSVWKYVEETGVLFGTP